MKNGINKKKRKKSFFFDDYTESEIIVEKKNINSIKVSLNRTSFLFFIFSSLILISIIKIFYLSLYPEKIFLSQRTNTDFLKERGDIIDRNGSILARNIDIYSAGVRPKLIKNKKKFLINLKLIFPELNKNKIKEKIEKNKFFYLKKRLTEDEKMKLWLLANKAIVFEKKQFRIYPQKNLLSHILGQIDDSNVGISGIEKFFDQNLKSQKLINSSK